MTGLNTTETALRLVICDLLDWAAQQGGWEAPCWAAARAAVHPDHAAAYACPQCGRSDNLRTTAAVVVELPPDGRDLVPMGDIEKAIGAWTMCGHDTCQRDGPLSDFETDNQT